MLFTKVSGLTPNKPVRVLLRCKYQPSFGGEKYWYEIGLLGGETNEPVMTINHDEQYMDVAATHWCPLEWRVL